MFAIKNKPFVHQSPQKPQKSFPFLWLILLFCGIAAGIYLAFSSFEKTISKNDLGEVVDISEQQKAKYLADSLKLTQCVQYALLAESDGWYDKCDGSGKVFLFRKQVWKYGTTCEKIPENRYSFSFYSTNNVTMVHQFYGNHLECEIEEKRKLYYYPTHPDNLLRKENEKLVLPPGNCKLQ